jgi:hypothetical protein
MQYNILFVLIFVLGMVGHDIIYVLLYNLHFFVIDRPLFILYKTLPKKLGFLGGDADELVCASISHTDVEFWKHNIPECEKIINRMFDDFSRVVYVLIYFYILYRSLSISVWTLYTKYLDKKESKLVYIIDNTFSIHRNQQLNNELCTKKKTTTA